MRKTTTCSNGSKNDIARARSSKKFNTDNQTSSKSSMNDKTQAKQQLAATAATPTPKNNTNKQHQQKQLRQWKKQHQQLRNMRVPRTRARARAGGATDRPGSRPKTPIGGRLFCDPAAQRVDDSSNPVARCTQARCAPVRQGGRGGGTASPLQPQCDLSQYMRSHQSRRRAPPVLGSWGVCLGRATNGAGLYFHRHAVPARLAGPVGRQSDDQPTKRSVFLLPQEPLPSDTRATRPRQAPGNPKPVQFHGFQAIPDDATATANSPSDVARTLVL